MNRHGHIIAGNGAVEVGMGPPFLKLQRSDISVVMKIKSKRAPSGATYTAPDGAGNPERAISTNISLPKELKRPMSRQASLWVKVGQTKSNQILNLVDTTHAPRLIGRNDSIGLWLNHRWTQIKK